MAVFPIITPNSPAVSINTASSSLSYQQLINTLWYISYKVKKIYLHADSTSQVGENYILQQQDSSGPLYSKPLKPYVSPYQAQPVINFDVSNDNFIINELTTMYFYLEPFASVQMYFFNDSASYSYLLKEDEIRTVTIGYDKKGSKISNYAIFAIAATVSCVAFYLLLDKKIKR